MDRAPLPDRLLEVLLAALADGTAGERRDVLVREWEQGPLQGTATPAALASIASFWVGDFVDATAWARRALSAPVVGEDPAPERSLALAGLALAACGDLGVAPEEAASCWEAARRCVDEAREAGEAQAATAATAATAAASRWWDAVRFVVVESALASARLADACSTLGAGPLAGPAWAGHPFHALMHACELRVSVFRGAIDDARDQMALLRAALVPGSRIHHLADALDALVGGNAADPAAFARALSCAEEVPASPRDFLDRGIFLLLGFGAVALGDVRTAASMILRAGADGDLGACTIIDRALGLEMLLVAALDDDDPAAASAWSAAIETLAEHPSAAPVVLRARSRSALAQGRAEDAVRAAEASVVACRRAGRQLEAAEGEIVLARARIAVHDVPQASRRLRALVSDSDAAGHHAVRRAAASALQPARRRLLPVAGGGWQVLTVRETEVAHLLVAGLEVDAIAAQLFLSPHTVRVHVSRVLCAFAVATRVGLLAALAGGAGGAGGADRPGAPPGQVSGAARGHGIGEHGGDRGGPGGGVVPDLSALTPRQVEVARLVAGGATNRQVADVLGISVKGVEKHVSDVLGRWQVGSRFELARRWWDVGRAEK